MPAFFDNIMGAMGVPDPYQELKDYSAAQTAKNRAAVDPNDPNILPSNQTPQATKTPQDMGSIIVDLTRRQQAEQGWNQAIGMGFGAFAQPRDREAVDKMFNVAPIDATKLGESIMGVNSNQQGQDQHNALLNIANNRPLLEHQAAALHMDPDLLAQLIRTNPQKAGELIANAATPTDALKNLGQLDFYGKQVANTPGATSADIEAIKSGITAGIPGERMAPMIQAQIAWRAKHGAEPPPWGGNDIQAFEQWRKNEASKEDTRGKAAENVVPIQEKSEELRRNLEQIRDNPALQSIMDDSVKREAARKVLSDPGSDFTAILARSPFNEQERGVLAMLKKISGANYSEALHSLVGTGTRVTQQEVAPLSASISQIGEMNMDYKHFVRQAINPLITRTKRIVASAYGSSGNFEGMDAEYQPWVHSTFTDKKGELYKEGSGADAFEPAKPVPADQLATFKAHLTPGATPDSDPDDKEDVLDHLQQQGYDVSKLRKLPVAKW